MAPRAERPSGVSGECVDVDVFMFRFPADEIASEASGDVPRTLGGRLAVRIGGRVALVGKRNDTRAMVTSRVAVIVSTRRSFDPSRRHFVVAAKPGSVQSFVFPPLTTKRRHFAVTPNPSASGAISSAAS